MRLFGLAVSAVLVTLGVVHPGFAEQPKPSDSTKNGAIVFVPPKSGKPEKRAGAGTRGLTLDTGMLTLMVPEGGGETTLAKPPLVWRLNTRFVGRIDSELVDMKNPAAGVVRSDKGRFGPGYYGVDLGRSKMELAPGSIYRWTISLVDEASGAVVDKAVTYIERQDTAGAPAAGPGASVADLAAAGLWFDALAPMVMIDRSGAAIVTNQADFDMLATSAQLSAK